MDALIELLNPERLASLVRAGLLITAGFILARLAATLPGRLLGKKLTAHQAMIARRIVYYIVLVIFLASALHELGFSLGVLLGAAGVLSVAIGFASQTSAANLISGLFLLGEKPFAIGDIITVGGTTGEVLSIDLLSVKLRTFDNLYVRIPNETLIKSETTTLTRFPIRRLDIKIGVAYKEDIARVRDVLMRVAENNPLCLDEPKPVVAFQNFGDSALELQFSVWATREHFTELRDRFREDIKRAFDAAGIEIPFPHLSLHAASVTEPFPLRLTKP